MPGIAGFMPIPCREIGKPIMTFIKNIANRVARDESGAVTVDWVVLTAAVVILAIGAIASLDTGLDGLITGVTDSLGDGATAVSGATW